MSDAAREPEDDEMSQLDQAGPTEVATDVEATADDTARPPPRSRPPRLRSRTW